MSYTSGELWRGRLCNQLFRNVAVSRVAEKFNLYVDYSNYDRFRTLGINLFVGERKHDNTIPLTDDNYTSVYTQETLDSNVDANNDFFQTAECSAFVYDYLRSKTMSESIMNANPFKERYNNNNDLFVHIRLGDTERWNPGIYYYLMAIDSIPFDTLYVASDDMNHFTVQEIHKIWPNSKLVELDEIQTIQFGSTCRNILLSHGSYSATIGYLGFYSTIHYPAYEPAKRWCGDMFSNEGWIQHIV